MHGAMSVVRLLLFVWASWGCGTLWAQPSVPWMPSESGRHALELLADEAKLDLHTTQWPLPISAISRALDALPADLPLALDVARERIRRELRANERSQLELTVRRRGDVLVGFGGDATTGSSVAGRSPGLTTSHLAMQIGARIEARSNADISDAQIRLDDSALVTEALGIQVQAWSHRSWWSPGWQNALALSNNAPALNGIGIQRASASTSESPWLAWMGPWNFDFFIARMEDVSQPANPHLVGGRITLRPVPAIEVGLSKMAQWGGRGRPQSMRSFLDILTGTHTNADGVAEQTQDPGNGLAGFDLRVRCPSGLRCAAYAEMIGEDEVGQAPSHYIGMYGTEWWSADGEGRLFAEYAETGCNAPVGRTPLRGCAYRNFAYPQGYASAGRWIGASIGPDSRLLTLGGMDVPRRSAIRLHLGRVDSRVGSFSPQVSDPQFGGRLVGVSVRRGFAWGAVTLTPAIDGTRVWTSLGARTELRIGVQVEAAMDELR
jgi:hypothetical protein